MTFNQWRTLLVVGGKIASHPDVKRAAANALQPVADLIFPDVKDTSLESKIRAAADRALLAALREARKKNPLGMWLRSKYVWVHGLVVVIVWCLTVFSGLALVSGEMLAILGFLMAGGLLFGSWWVRISLTDAYYLRLLHDYTRRQLEVARDPEFAQAVHNFVGTLQSQ